MSKEYTFIFQHTNGAMVYEASDGEKYIKYDDLVFTSMAQVNAYVKETGIQLWPKDPYEIIEAQEEGQFVTLSMSDYKKLKGK